MRFSLFFATVSAPAHLYPLSLHDALPISLGIRINELPMTPSKLWKAIDQARRSRVSEPLASRALQPRTGVSEPLASRALQPRTGVSEPLASVAGHPRSKATSRTPLQ